MGLWGVGQPWGGSRGSWAALPSLLLELLPMCLLQGFGAELASWWWVPLRVSGGVSGGFSPSKPPWSLLQGVGGLHWPKAVSSVGGLPCNTPWVL